MTDTPENPYGDKKSAFCLKVIPREYLEMMYDIEHSSVDLSWNSKLRRLLANRRRIKKWHMAYEELIEPVWFYQLQGRSRVPKRRASFKNCWLTKPKNRKGWLIVVHGREIPFPLVKTEAQMILRWLTLYLDFIEHKQGDPC